LLFGDGWSCPQRRTDSSLLGTPFSDRPQNDELTTHDCFTKKTAVLHQKNIGFEQTEQIQWKSKQVKLRSQPTSRKISQHKQQDSTNNNGRQLLTLQKDMLDKSLDHAKTNKIKQLCIPGYQV
jgi:hypothetical protein